MSCSERSAPPLVVSTVAVMAAAVLTQPVAGQCQTRNVEGSAIHYCVEGSGSPTIVLAAGAGLASGTWASLVPRLAELGTVVTFDRPGLGPSPAGAAPRSPRRIAIELAALLEAASLPTPYVFVGHSMGGHHVIGAARIRIDDTAGVIVLDTPHPDFETDRLTLLTPVERAERSATLAAGLARAPRVVADERTGAREDPPTLMAGALRDVPLTVVVADQQNFGPLGSASAHRELWISRADDFLALSSRARRIIARGSGHMVHIEQPDLVIELVRAASAGQP